jgi:hypothetical protein
MPRNQTQQGSKSSTFGLPCSYFILPYLAWSQVSSLSVVVQHGTYAVSIGCLSIHVLLGPFDPYIFSSGPYTENNFWLMYSQKGFSQALLPNSN